MKSRLLLSKSGLFPIFGLEPTVMKRTIQKTLSNGERTSMRRLETSIWTNEGGKRKKFFSGPLKRLEGDQQAEVRKIMGKSALCLTN